MEKPAYWLTRFVLLRLLGAMYAVAFLVAINQVLPLIGSHGLLPLGNYFDLIGNALNSRASGFMHLPSLFWFNHSDAMLLSVCWIGFVLSLIVTAGYANSLIMVILWFLYLSIIHAGQEWYGYGWEIQLTETGFLAVFLCPLIDMRPFPKYPPPFLIIVLFRWLVFRVMFGAGMIKLRGDATWRNATALYAYFETQPIPGPLTRWFHFLPKVLLRAGVWYNWLAELVAPCFVFWPRIGRHIAGVVMILLQVFIIISGNLSFLNWLTIIPALACFDDAFWAKILPACLVNLASAAAQTTEEPTKASRITILSLTLVVGLLSIMPVINLLSSGQAMNRSFEPFELVNTYGAFGSVGEERYNVVFEGTADDTTGNKAHWKPYLYKGLPVLLNKRPPQIAPYQLRLDWQMWFAAMSTAGQYPWTYHLVWKLLHNDPGALSLFADNPFPGRPPRFIRAIRYRYRFVPPGNPDNLYWTRERLDEWLPILSADNPVLIAYLKSWAWIH